jgi:ribA/ribD-fused uncharacterized protein
MWVPQTWQTEPFIDVESTVKTQRKVIDWFDGDPDYDFLSNFHPSTVGYRGGKAATVEHAFQAAKTVDYNDFHVIMTARGPGEAKGMGRDRRLEIREDWDTIKIGVMYMLLTQKFSHPELREKLLATGDAELIEGNTWHDNIWGSCICGSMPRCAGEGENWLGRLLMQVRDEVRDAERA